MKKACSATRTSAKKWCGGGKKSGTGSLDNDGSQSLPPELNYIPMPALYTEKLTKYVASN